jgi:SAM-dependent methyltransferase
MHAFKHLRAFARDSRWAPRNIHLMSKMKPLAMHPSGVTGRVFGALMEAINEPTYRAALKALAPIPTDRILEIGFGTGRFAELLLGFDPTVSVAGVDPTATMVETARRRRKIRAAGLRADLRQGDASSLAWADGYFNAVVAIHSFQFWPDPSQAVREILRVAAPGGRLLLVLRSHARQAPAWLPNPLSRSGDEVRATTDFLETGGFDVSRLKNAGSSSLLLAVTEKV